MLLTGSTIMFVTMISVGVIVAKFRNDWAHHTDAGKASLAAQIECTKDLTKCNSKRMGRNCSHLDLCKYIPWTV